MCSYNGYNLERSQNECASYERALNFLQNVVSSQFTKKLTQNIILVDMSLLRKLKKGEKRYAKCISS